MSTLNVTIVQADLLWHDAGRNLAQFTETIGSLDEPTDLIVLPEMFTTGFTMDAKSHAEKMHGRAMNCMAQWAEITDAAICGSLIVQDGTRYFNRFVFMRPDGRADYYDKRHLFRLAGEVEHYSPGDRQVVIEWRDWRILPMICYDLRFPVWSRNRPDLNYDLMLYVANWPSRRHHAWQTLLRARAIENLSFLVGVNRTGIDGNDLPYAGGSAVIDYLGEELVNLGDHTGMATTALDKSALQRFRKGFPFDVDADEFLVKPDRSR